MFEGWKHECKAREFCLRDNDIVVDVGACVGGWTIPAAMIGKQVIAFEPNAYWARILSANIALNKLNDKAFVETSAVWSKDEELSYDGWSINDQYDQPRPVKGVKLDSLALEPDFIKVDTEGGELNVIEGARETIVKCKPRLMIEAHKEYHKDATAKVKEMVQSYIPDYKMTILDENETQYTHCYFEVL